MAAVLLALVVCVGAPGRVGAQPTDEAAYRDTIESAVAELAAGRHAEALALFRQAHRIAPSARTLRGIAMASFELGDYVATVRHAERALESDTRPLPAELRAQTEALSRHASAFVARYRLTLSPRDATLRLDGVRAELEAQSVLLVSLGRHVLRAEAPGHASVEEVVVVRGGEREPLDLRLPPVDGSDPEAPDPAPRRPAPGPGTPDLTAAHAMVTVAAATGAGAGGTWGWYANRLEAVRACGGRCANSGDLDDQRDAALVTSVALTSAALALGVVGVLLWFAEERRGAQTSACRPAPAGVTCAFSSL